MNSRKPLKKPRLALRREEKISKGLRTLATLQLEAALAELKGSSLSPEAVHNTRTYIKKVGAIINLASPALGRVHRDHLLELLHEAASRLGPLRDAEVQIQSLDLAIETAGLPAEEFSSLRNGLTDIAKQRRINDRRHLPRITGFLEKVLKSIPDWPLDALGNKELRRRIRRTYRRGRITLDVCHESHDPELFHSWRKQVKQLGYQLRITAKFWPDSSAELISVINSIGEFAGQERDFTLLIQTMKHGPKTRSSELVLGLMEKMLPPLRREAMEAGTRLYEAKPTLFIEPLDFSA